MVDQEIELRRESLNDRLSRSGSDLDGYLAAVGTTAAELDAEFDADARRAVKAGFILDKLAVQEKLGVDQAELSAYVAQQAYRMGIAPDRLAKELTDRQQLGSVIADVLRGKALTLIAERAKITDESGREVDLKELAALDEQDQQDGPDEPEQDETPDQESGA
jgi:trigger factor